MSDFRSSEIPNGSDLISRKTAIDLIEDRFMALGFSDFGTSTFRDGLADGYARVISDLKRIPSARSEPKIGKWIEESDRKYHWHCSECGYVIGLLKMDSKYCPNCGAKMEGGDDE